MKLNAKRKLGTVQVLDRNQMKNVKGGSLNPGDGCENIVSHTACYAGSTFLGVVSGSFGCPRDYEARCYQDFGTFTSAICYCTH